MTTKVITDLDSFEIIYFAAMKEKKALAFRLKSDEVPRQSHLIFNLELAETFTGE